MKKFLLASAIFCVSLFSNQIFAQQVKTTTKATTNATAPVQEQRGDVVKPKANTPKSLATKQNVQKTPEQRADMRINRVEKKAGKLSNEQKAKLKSLFLDEINQISAIKPAQDPKAENPFVAIRKKTEEKVKTLLTPEQLALYIKPMQTATKGKTGTTKPMPNVQKPTEHSPEVIEHHSEEKQSPTKNKKPKNN